MRPPVRDHQVSGEDTPEPHIGEFEMVPEIQAMTLHVRLGQVADLPQIDHLIPVLYELPCRRVFQIQSDQSVYGAILGCSSAGKQLFADLGLLPY